MAYESVAITAGSGTNIAVDTIATQNYQAIKIDVGADGVASGPVCLANPLPVAPAASTGGGASTFHLVLAAGANGTRIKATAGKVFGIDITNNSANMFYVQFHDSAANPPVLNSTTVVRKVGCQAGVPRYLPFGDLGLAFTVGIGITVTSDILDTGTATVAAGAGIVDIQWI